MNLEEIEKTDIWELYEKCSKFMSRRGIYTDTDVNYRMYNGDQWHGLEVKGVEKVQYNFIKQVVKQKVSNITSNLFAVNYSPENIENPEFTELAQKTCDLLNKKASKVFDKDFLDKKIKKWVKQAAINDEAVAYVYYGQDDNPVNEVISKNDVMYGDENEEEIQLQPYILIRQRKSISELQEHAKDLEIPNEKIKLIVPDNDTSTIAGDSGKDEVDDKCWVVTKFYRKDGTIHFDRATKYCELNKDENTQMSLYPIAHYNWEDQEGNARGIGEVRQLIPNQIETNKTAMRRALSVKNTAYPQKVVNIDSVTNPDAVNKIGSTIKFKSMGGVRASDVFMNTIPAQMSGDSEKVQTELINYSRDLNNAGDATTGNINPESASGRAILAVQNAQNQPLSDQVVAVKVFIEDLARIWFEMWKVYATDGLLIEVDETDPITGQITKTQKTIPQFVLEELSTSVKVDITPKGAFDKYAQELSLENMFTTGKITFEEYVESLDSDSVMPKTKLENILKKRKEAEKQINTIQQQADLIKMQAQQNQADALDIQAMANEGSRMMEEATAM